jgi:hypothetical protein
MRIAWATLLAAGVLNPRAEVEAHPQQSAGPAEQARIEYEISQPGQVSLGIYDASDRQVRTLLTGVKQEAGKHSFTWDGLDRYGQTQPAGEYTWRLLRTPGFKRELVVQLGINAIDGVYGDWPGNHWGPNAVTFDRHGDMYVVSLSSEGPPTTLKVSGNGDRRMFSATLPYGPPPERSPYDAAVIADILFLLCDDGSIYVQSSETGRLLYGHPIYRKYAEQRIPLVNVGVAGDPKFVPKNGTFYDFPMHLTSGADFLVVTNHRHNFVRFYSPVGVVMKEIELPAPRGAAVSPDNRVFVISGRQIVEVSKDSGQTKTLVNDPQLLFPTRLTYDPANNDLLVVQHDPKNNPYEPASKDTPIAKVNNVRRYSAADGKLVAVYGRPEGRTYGVYNPLDWDGILDIAADGHGGFVTVEEFPRRVARFSGREKHALIKEWFGGNAWGSLCFLDPADPTITWFPGGTKHLARGKIDYAKKSWTMTHLYDLPENFSWGNKGPDGLFPAFGGRSSFWEPRRVGGDTYLVNNGRLDGGEGVSIVRIDERANKVVPVARLGALHPGSVWDRPTNTMTTRNMPSWWVNAMMKAGYDPGTWKGVSSYGHLNFAWCDTNGDGRLDLDEITVAGPTVGPKQGSGYTEAHYFVDAKWNVYRVGMWGTSVPSDPLHAWLKIPNEAKEGEPPIWNWNHAQPSAAKFDTVQLQRCPLGSAGIFQDSQGSIYQVCQGNTDGQGWDVPVLKWPNNAVSTARFMKWNASGALEWSVGVHTDAQAIHKYNGPYYVEADFSVLPPAELSHVRGILGEVKKSVVVIDSNQPAAVWTRDGLYAGSFVDGRVKDSIPDYIYNDLFADDHQWGQVLETPKGEVLWCAMSSDGTPVFRIHGWDNWERKSGSLKLKAPAASVTWGGSGVKAEYFANLELKGEPVLTRVDPCIRYGPLKGPFRELAAKADWFKAGDPAELRAGKFSARWSGLIEAPVSEDFEFTLYTDSAKWGEAGDKIGGARVRLWIDGKLVIDDWGAREDNLKGGYSHRLPASKPVPLQGGRLVPIKLEYAGLWGGPGAHVHLYWKSPLTDLRHVPQTLLYPGLPKQP